MAEGGNAGRSTAIVLFTDLVGSTKLRARLGEEAAEELRRAHDRLLTGAVEANSGRVVKGLGDGIMATFAGASAAVAAAVAIQQAVERHNRAANAVASVEVRVGISAGDVTVEDDDVHGTPVIEAARICGIAAGGEILASEMVRWLARSTARASFTSVGTLELKGLPDAVRAVRVGWEPLASSSVPLPALLTDVGRIFVGRDAELERLSQLWKEATAGERRVAFLAGEPGVGRNTPTPPSSAGSAVPPWGVPARRAVSRIHRARPPALQRDRRNRPRPAPRGRTDRWTRPIPAQRKVKPRVEGDRMIDDVFVADAVVHGYNWGPSNFAIPEAAMTSAAGFGFHQFLSPDSPARLTESEFVRDWPTQDIEDALFVESGADLVCYHGTPIYDFYRDGHSATHKGLEWKAREPNRVLVYGDANPMDGSAALRRLEELADQGANGIKVYAARFYQGRTIPQPLDDPEFGYPFIEKALDLGIRVIATHKAIPFGPVRAEPYSVGDLPQACARYPEMNFEVVHAGFAFLEETALLAASFGNVWLNLEVCGSFAAVAPRRFAELLGPFLQYGAEDRILFATGCPLVHPLPAMRAFLDFEMPADLVSGMGYPEVTAEMKRKILGGNFLRLHGIDEESFVKKVDGDRWAEARRAAPTAEPWSHLRRRGITEEKNDAGGV